MSTQTTLDGTASAPNARSKKPLIPKEILARFNSLVERRAQYLQSKQGAAWWSYIEPVLVRLEAQTPAAVKLRCLICQILYESSNESRLAKEHILKQACNVLENNADKALEVSAQLKRQASAANSSADESEDSVNRRQGSRLGKRKANTQPISRFAHSAETLALAKQQLIDFFHEASDCVAMHACEHPKLKACLQTLGGRTLNAEVIASGSCQHGVMLGIATCQAWHHSQAEHIQGQHS